MAEYNYLAPRTDRARQARSARSAADGVSEECSNYGRGLNACKYYKNQRYCSELGRRLQQCKYTTQPSLYGGAGGYGPMPAAPIGYGGQPPALTAPPYRPMLPPSQLTTTDPSTPGYPALTAPPVYRPMPVLPPNPRDQLTTGTPVDPNRRIPPEMMYQYRPPPVYSPTDTPTGAITLYNGEPFYDAQEDQFYDAVQN